MNDKIIPPEERFDPEKGYSFSKKEWAAGIALSILLVPVLWTAFDEALGRCGFINKHWRDACQTQTIEPAEQDKVVSVAPPSLQAD